MAVRVLSSIDAAAAPPTSGAPTKTASRDVGADVEAAGADEKDPDDGTEERRGVDASARGDDVGADGESADDAGDQPDGDAGSESDEKSGDESEEPTDAEEKQDDDDIETALRLAKGDPDRAERILAAMRGEEDDEPETRKPAAKSEGNEEEDPTAYEDVADFYKALASAEKDDEGKPKDPQVEAKGLAKLLQRREARMLDRVTEAVQAHLMARERMTERKAAFEKKYPDWEKDKTSIRLEYLRLGKQIGHDAARRLPIEDVYRLVLARKGKTLRDTKAAARAEAVAKKNGAVAATTGPQSGRPAGPMERRKPTSEEETVRRTQEFIARRRQLPG